MTDHRFAYDPTIQVGRVLFRVRNSGTVPHNLYLLPLTDDMPSIDEQLRGTERRAITPLAMIKARPPGTATTLAVDLQPGVRYALVCFVKDDEGVSHAMHGMAAEFVPAPTGPRVDR